MAWYSSYCFSIYEQYMVYIYVQFLFNLCWHDEWFIYSIFIYFFTHHDDMI